MHTAHPPEATGRMPDFLIVGAPKAGTSALHAALSRHPDLWLSGVKEPKYFLCGDAPSPAYRGPGDAHRPALSAEQRNRLLEPLPDDIEQLETAGDHGYGDPNQLSRAAASPSAGAASAIGVENSHT